MTQKRTLFLAVLALLILLGSPVMAQTGSNSPLVSEKDIDDAKSKYWKDDFAMKERLMAEKVKDYKKYFATAAGSNSGSDDDKLIEVISDRVSIEKMEKMQKLDAATRKKVMNALNLKMKDMLSQKDEVEKKRIKLKTRLAEIENANNEADDSKSMIAKLRLAKKVCDEIEASTNDSCVRLNTQFTAFQDRPVLTDDEIRRVKENVKFLRVLWVQKHYLRWMEQAEKIETKLVRVETKIELLVSLAKGDNLENVDKLVMIQQRFKRIHSAYQDKVQNLKGTYAEFESAPTYEGALKVRAAAHELKLFGKFSVHAVNRFVYLYRNLNRSGEDDGTPITSAEIAKIVDSVPLVDAIEAQSASEISSAIATADVPASRLVSIRVASDDDENDDSSETDDSGNDSERDIAENNLEGSA